jgi:hypothetical protein
VVIIGITIDEINANSIFMGIFPDVIPNDFPDFFYRKQ